MPSCLLPYCHVIVQRRHYYYTQFTSLSNGGVGVAPTLTTLELSITNCVEVRLKLNAPPSTSLAYTVKTDVPREREKSVMR